MARDLFDPRMMAELADFTPSTCTVQQDLGTDDGFGETIAAWADLADHVDLDCAHAPSGAQGKEYQRANGDFVVANYITLLAGAYPLVTELMQVVVAGPRAGTYEIGLVHIDSHSTMTRLLTRRVS